MEDDVKLATVVAARALHDVAAPAGALSLALEMVRDYDGQADQAEALGMLAGHMNALRAKLEFSRASLGGGFARGCSELESARSFVEGFLGTFSKHKLEWLGGYVPTTQAGLQVVLNLVWLAVDACPRAGTISISGQVQDGVARVVVATQSERSLLKENVQDGLTGKLPPAEWNHWNAPAVFVYRLLTVKGLQLAIDTTAQGVTFTLTGPSGTI